MSFLLMNGSGWLKFLAEIPASLICSMMIAILWLKLATMSFAKAVTKQFLASQKVLVGLRLLPSYGDIEGKQAMRLLQVIDKGGNLSSDQAAGILQLLDEYICSEPNRKGQRKIGIQDDCIRTSRLLSQATSSKTTMTIPRMKIGKSI